MRQQKTVVIATMKLDLGGAETHIVELCRELHRQGHRVVAVSAGGLLVQALEEAGVRHVEAPLDSRSPAAMYRARRILARLLDEVRPEVVHAHARIPAFLLNALCRRRKIPMVTTVHGSYKVSPAYRLLTRWGIKSLSVSEDLTSYLKDNYGISERDIFETVNGIDTERFAPDPSLREQTRRALGIAPGEILVLTVSRLDPDASGGARRLLEEAPMLRAACPAARIVVVGGGSEFAQLAAQADRLNREAGIPYLTLTGPRVDIPVLCNAADLFVGVSRAALEAAACGLPVVLAGTAGYIGLLEQQTLQTARQTNLTCRGQPYGALGCVAADVEALIADPERRRQLGDFGRALVLREYSVARMAQDALDCYRAALTGAKWARYDFLLCGYYGYGNAGDELLLSTIVHNLLEADPDLRICVLNQSKWQASCSQQVALARRFSPHEVLRAIHRSSVLLFGGGNLLQDVTSRKSLYYYLSLLWLAGRLGCKTMLYGNGIGPLNNADSRRRTAALLRRVDRITLRDPDSLRLLQRLGLPTDHISMTADEVFTALGGPLPRMERLPMGDYLAVSLRDWRQNDPALVPKVAAALDAFAQQAGIPVLLVPFHATVDTEACRLVQAAMKTPALLFEGSSDEVLSAITNAALVVGMRLHALVFATAAGVPSVGIVYDDKVRAFFEMLGERRLVECDDLDGEALRRYLLDLWEMRAQAAQAARREADRLRGLAAQNAKAAFVLLRGEVNE
ncbi:MAG: polysaccharide pyruvyl transferase CsaB [Clostridiales bacterium]|nr:polysaccharide pyruvyl transferase CsaB [Clostridiales bacterium]